ncbi:methionine ABC transporter ATP-binding protein [Paenibacillus polymyxa]|uniref:ABC transporter ATP-binding protein n=1 Tax=Paenibacillus polymyxa TaxID=1406 RepID=A0A378XSK7_PAEPO|nr:methionine ABC transporter ATP-binding protein [Paenibacillus polymyxa]MBE7897631.1 methionine ABC transporter ATP-binding protein [Paenibacillus polymyxa]MBG9764173.1 phosphate ABC transporter ATP-binding protein [Paenibacillus polymyxa]MCC3260488.1 methionine ABC transporter ATP-binding protein [Paenibacillus polymyxa]QPK51971.1 methionine ABC transporter ATP-binding protein [Paenibacillus polymyxa]QPK57056.1 methionine ABC transporter ATP-binding protein [Paenibacillus polymyxa]
MIKFEQVSKIFSLPNRKVSALEEVSLSVGKGEIFGVIGFSGAGKSTLLRLVNLLERPSEGRIVVNDQDITQIRPKELRNLRRRIGMVFQTFNLFNSRTVYGNLAYPLKLAKLPKAQIDVRVKEMLQFVGLEDKADSYPEQLSGGQKQRVGIARALANSPDILICDEATSALDPETTEDILKLLKKVNEDYQITILLITHEMNVIRSICDRVAVMENGRVIEQGSVFDVFANPQTKTTKNFIRSVLNDQLSPKLLDKIREHHVGRLYRLVFRDGATSEPVLSRATRKYNLDYNIVYGSINELQGALFGSLIVELIGAEDEVNKVVEELRTTVEVREVVDHES